VRGRDTVNQREPRVFLMSHGFAGLVQSQFNRDKIQDTNLTRDNVLNICKLARCSAIAETALQGAL